MAQLLPVMSADAAAEHGIAAAVEMNGTLFPGAVALLSAVDLSIPGTGASLFLSISIPWVNTAMRTAAPVQRRRRQPCMCVRPSEKHANRYFS
jgi:hypothetical protein